MFSWHDNLPEWQSSLGLQDTSHKSRFTHAMVLSCLKEHRMQLQCM